MAEIEAAVVVDELLFCGQVGGAPLSVIKRYVETQKDR